MVDIGMRRYVLKQSLFQRPSCWMSHRGRPAAAAVVAAPIRNECVEIGARLVEGSAKLRIVVSLRLVRNVPSKYVNNGPVLLRWCANNCFKATIGHNALCVGARRIIHPFRKGSVFDDFIFISAWSLTMQSLVGEELDHARTRSKLLNDS